ncbi:MAG: aspartate carbamoyltransferase catalytic subunit [Candidatus Tectomicrobia bacterium]|uniref:Aspartate carbamoyltransferase n=1 Tax=Tectimicrobiota bacterium TaxID=2528274 RepID=A0A932GQ49_UNCTE|nr:aspartate carbamoyltransferase catalytic subunit [Candidatus Tectomicrobia bacterium]
METDGHFARKDLLGLEDLSSEEILTVLQAAKSFQEISRREVKKVPTLRGQTVINLFYEPSTRTRTSFELAAKRLSADVVNFTVSESSAVKGETLVDTARNIESMHSDIIVVRHPVSGAPHLLARIVKSAVINAGDGTHEHPSQGLLDLFTIQEHKGKLEGLKVLIVGDISHSRVARSNIYGMRTLGLQVTVCGPPTLIPVEMERMGVRVTYDFDDALTKTDVIMMLRIQMERQHGGLYPSLREYARLFGLNRDRLNRAKPDVLIMHPGPVNRGVEISPEIADCTRSLILEQVSNGVAVRMALLYLLSRGAYGKAAH